MTAGIEREFKLPLPSEDHFTAVLARLESLGAEVQPSVLQVNHFFDTEELVLRSALIGLRLRAEGAEHELCLKGPESNASGALAVRPEEQLALDAATARLLLTSQRSPLAVLAESPLASSALVLRARELVGKEPLVYLGSFENERTRVGPVRLPTAPSAPALRFELDRTRFSGGRIERELEVELPAEADGARIETALRELFGDLGVAPRSLPSKSERFFRSLEAS